jgi:DNA repair exonuclease SbcCD ATPase subunit
MVDNVVSTDETLSKLKEEQEENAAKVDKILESNASQLVELKEERLERTEIYEVHMKRNGAPNERIETLHEKMEANEERYKSLMLDLSKKVSSDVEVVTVRLEAVLKKLETTESLLQMNSSELDAALDTLNTKSDRLDEALKKLETTESLLNAKKKAEKALISELKSARGVVEAHACTWYNPSLPIQSFAQMPSQKV